MTGPAANTVSGDPSMLLTCRSLVQNFGHFRATDNCSIAVPKGSITGLIGPNGAGKTTLFNLIAGAFRPTAGQIVFKGEDITRLPSDQRFRRGLVRTFQIPHEFHSLTVIENLMMVPPDQPGERILSNWISPRRVAQAEEKNRARAWDALQFLELTHVAYERAGLLSGGQKKLLELGRTLMTSSELVLLDEPAAGVNRTLLRKLEEKILYLNQQRGYTFILIEHDMETIGKLCDPVICMAEGKVLVEGGFATVRSDPRVLEAYLGETAGGAA